MDFCEQMFTKASQNSDISASCSENIVTVAFYVNVKSCRYFINRLALNGMTPFLIMLRTSTKITKKVASKVRKELCFTGRFR
jgi:hypothetical protein